MAAAERYTQSPSSASKLVGGPWLAVVFLVAIVAAGTLGYVVIEGWSVWDGFYMTITTVATVGFREVHPLSRAGEVFTVLLICGGVGTAFYTATLVATVVVEGGVHRHLERRAFTRMLEDLQNHFILCGYGRIGAIIAEDLARQGVPFVIIEREVERLAPALERGWLGLAADASREDVLRKAGIDRARGLIAAVGTDAENVYTVLTARVMRQDLFIIARVESDDAEPKLRRAGANRIVSPYQIGASHISQTALRPTVVDFVALATSAGHLDLSMEQVLVRPSSAYAGKNLIDAGFRQKFGVIIVAIKRADGPMEFNPAPESIIRTGDEMIVLGRPEHVKALEEEVSA
jgi:voltage-gated potassium channel